MNRFSEPDPSFPPECTPFDPESEGADDALRALRADESTAQLIVLLVGDHGDWGVRASLRAAEVCGASADRALLIDLDLEGDALGRWLKEPPREGISDVVLFGASLQHAGRPTPSGAVTFVPAGTVVSDPVAVLGHESLHPLLRGVIDQGTTVLLSLPEGTPGADDLVRIADAVVVLASAEELPSVVSPAFDGSIVWLSPDGEAGPDASAAQAEDVEASDRGDSPVELQDDLELEDRDPAPLETEAVASPIERVDDGVVATDDDPISTTNAETAENGGGLDQEFTERSVEAIDAIFTEDHGEPDPDLASPFSEAAADEADLDSEESVDSDPWAAFRTAPDSPDAEESADDETDTWDARGSERDSWSEGETETAEHAGEFEPAHATTFADAGIVDEASLEASYDGLPEVEEKTSRKRSRILAALLVLVVAAGAGVVWVMPHEAADVGVAATPRPQPEPVRPDQDGDAVDPQFSDPLAGLGQGVPMDDPSVVAAVGQTDPAAESDVEPDIPEVLDGAAPVGSVAVEPAAAPSGEVPEIAESELPSAGASSSDGPTDLVDADSQTDQPTTPPVAAISLPTAPAPVPMPADPRAEGNEPRSSATGSDAGPQGPGDPTESTQPAGSTGPASAAIAVTPNIADEPEAPSGDATEIGATAAQPDVERPDETAATSEATTSTATPEPPTPAATEASVGADEAEPAGSTDDAAAVSGEDVVEEPTGPVLRVLDRPAGLMAFALEIATHTTLARASSQVLSLQTQHTELEFLAVPVQRAGGVGFRVLAGPAATPAEAERIRTALSSTLGAGVTAAAEVRATGWAFLLGVFENPNEAMARVQTAQNRNLPVSVAEVPINDTRAVYRVYSGAFASEDEATALGKLLEEAGLGPARLTERTGRPVLF